MSDTLTFRNTYLAIARRNAAAAAIQAADQRRREALDRSTRRQEQCRLDELLGQPTPEMFLPLPKA
jgi:hypothetical protein